MDDFAIRIKNVSKNFRLPHEKVSSVKGIFTSWFRSRAWQQFETQHALKNISFDVPQGEFFGIVGRNGSGKSTLLKMLAGIYQPTAGSVQVQGKLVPFIELGVGFNPELTGRENVYLNGALLGFTTQQIDKQYDDIVAFAELEDFMDQKLKNYSSGMQVRLAFSVATTAKADILLVDEVLAVGDADFQRKCFEYFRKLKKAKKTVVFVTHDMNAVREYCDRAMLIDESQLKEIGRPETIAQAYAQLFMEKDESTTEEDKSKKRWGNGAAKYNKISTKLTTDNLVITTTIRVHQSIEKLVYGIHIFSTDGRELTATNNRMIAEPDVESLMKGDEVQLSWEVLNIFNDGKYLITLTLVDSVGSVFDWYNEAAAFTVKRAQRSTTPILPPIKVNTKAVKQSKRKG